MKFQEKKIHVAGNSISYMDEGDQGKMPIIFIHGFPFNKSMWENQLSVFKESHRVIAYDVRGHGNADSGTGEFSIDKFAKDLFHFMDALHLEKACICGLSMGGYIALTAVTQQPERIAALILCDTQCSADSEEGKKKRIEAIASIRENGLTEYASNSLKKLFSENSLTRKKEAVQFIEQTILNTDVETICNTLLALAGRKETCTSLHAIDIPVLILVGIEDQLTTPEAAKKMHALIPGSTLAVIDQAGHLTNLENPESFNLHLKKLLNSVG